LRKRSKCVCRYSSTRGAGIATSHKALVAQVTEFRHRLEYSVGAELKPACGIRQHRRKIGKAHAVVRDNVDLRWLRDRIIPVDNHVDEKLNQGALGDKPAAFHAGAPN
jgi:hypothetical protein